MVFYWEKELTQILENWLVASRVESSSQDSWLEEELVFHWLEHYTHVLLVLANHSSIQQDTLLFI